MRCSRFRQYAGGNTGSPRKARSDGAITRATCAMSSSIVMQEPRKTSVFSCRFFYVRTFCKNRFINAAQTSRLIVRKQNRQVKVSDRISRGQCSKLPLDFRANPIAMGFQAQFAGSSARMLLRARSLRRKRCQTVQVSASIPEDGRFASLVRATLLP